MLGAAALGVIVYYELPNIFIAVSKLSAEKRLNSINAKLNKLAEEWGADSVTLPDFADPQSASGKKEKSAPEASK